MSGFGILPNRLTLNDYDHFVETAGLVPVARWSTWDRVPFDHGEYAVVVHRRPTDVHPVPSSGRRPTPDAIET